jgi:hypothetical protein
MYGVRQGSPRNRYLTILPPSSIVVKLKECFNKENYYNYLVINK